MAELMSVLADAKIEAAENVEKIHQLEALLNLKKVMVFKGGVYYQKTESHNYMGHYPFI